MQETLSPPRYAHSLSVADTAAMLARRWGMDEKKAYLAGLLHDFEHYKSGEEMLSAALLYGLPVGDAELETPLLLHGPLAAKVLQDDYGCDDPEILEAIRYHTVPHTKMGDLAKIIYLADIVEPTRPAWDGIEALRALSEQDLDAAMVLALSRTMDYLQQNGETPHPDTPHLLREFEQIARSKEKFTEVKHE